jgi:hypothetical protein
MTSSVRTRSTAQLAATVAAAVFLVVGIAGFIPGITTDYDSMKFAGHESMAMLLGIFCVSILHNIVHLLFGIVGFVLARTPGGAVQYLIGSGVIYAVLWLYGLLIDQDSAANFVPINTADNWLHFVLAVGLLGLGFALRGRGARRSASV